MRNTTLLNRYIEILSFGLFLFLISGWKRLWKCLMYYIEEYYYLLLYFDVGAWYIYILYEKQPIKKQKEKYLKTSKWNSNTSVFMYENIMRKWGWRTHKKEGKRKSLGKNFYIFLCVFPQSTCCLCSTSVTSIIKYKWRSSLLLILLENLFMIFYFSLLHNQRYNLKCKTFESIINISITSRFYFQWGFL